MVGKNEPLPERYRDYPYFYSRTKSIAMIRKYYNERFLMGDDATQFVREINRAKQKGRSLSDVIEEYFIN